MTFLKKINRGLVILIALVLGIACYLTGLHFARKEDRAQIEDLLQTYLGVLQKDLPLTDTPEAAEDAAKEHQKEFFADEREYEPIASQLRELYQLQEERGGISSAVLSLTRMESVYFEGDTAVVTTPVSTNIEADGDLADALYTGRIFAEFSLQKVNGEWKLYYYDLWFYDGGGSRNGSTFTY